MTFIRSGAALRTGVNCQMPAAELWRMLRTCGQAFDWRISGELFVTKRLDGIEPRRLDRRKKSGNHADEGAEHNGQDHGPRRDDR